MKRISAKSNPVSGWTHSLSGMNFVAVPVLMALSFFLTSSSLVAKSYKIPTIQIQTQIQPDGSLDVDEHIQYSFKGRYRYAYRTIPLLAGERVSQISVSEQGVPFRLSEDETPGSYTVTGEDSGFEVRWNFSARNESRTFHMSYTIQGAVHRYPDIAELHYNFLGNGWSKKIGHLEALVKLPQGTDSAGLSAWVRDPIRGTVQSTSDGILFSARNWPRRTSFSGRVLFPGSAVSGLRQESSQPMKAEISQAEERALAEALANEEVRQERQAALFPWMFAIPAVTWILWYLLFMQHGKPHQVRSTVPAGQLPDHDPLFARWVRHKMVGAETLVATLFDLARRGYLKVREEEPESAKARKKAKNDYYFEIQQSSQTELRAFEKDLIEFGATQLGSGQGFRISDLQRVAKKQRSKFRKWFRKWSESFKEEAEGQQIFELYPVGPMVINVLLGLFCALLGLGTTLWTDSPAGLPAMILGVLQLAFTGFLSRRTQNGQRLFQEWSEFRKQVRAGDTTRLKLQENWDRALIAAVSLGLVKKFNSLLESTDHVIIAPWFYSLHGDVSGVSGITSSIQSMVSSVSSTTTSATGAAGAGAAASGGGGGGAG